MYSSGRGSQGKPEQSRRDWQACQWIVLVALAITLLIHSSQVAAQEPITKITGNSLLDVSNNQSWFGDALCGLADFNKDGEFDLLVGAPRHTYESSGGYSYGNAGAAYVISGPLDSASGSKIQLTFSYYPSDSEKFGSSVAFVKSYNDGTVPDAVVGAPGYGNNGQQGLRDAGRAFVYYGGTTPSQLPDVELAPGGTIDYEGFGHSVASAGAFDDDSLHDIVVGAPVLNDTTDKPGRAYVFYGSAAPSAIEYADLIYEGENEDDHFGSSVDGGSDITGDSTHDIVVGAPDYDDLSDTEVGRAYVIAGHDRPDSVLLPLTASIGTAAHATLQGEIAGDNFGTVVAIVGDLNADGTADIVVSAPGYDVSGQTRGAVYVFLGGTTLTGTISADEASMRINGSATGWGAHLAAAGDLNADGYDDFIVGDWLHSSGGESARGRAHVIYGGDRFQPYDSQVGLVVHDYTELSVDLYLGEDANDGLGTAFAAVGDVNGDKLDDVAVGSRKHDEDGKTAGALFIYDSALQLSDVSAGSGLDFSGFKPYASANIDYDADDINNKGQDLLLTFDGMDGQLYRNGGVFGAQLKLIDKTADDFVADVLPDEGSKGIAVADYNNDGVLDAFIAHATYPRLYRGGSGSVLQDVYSSEITSGAENSVAAAWGDYDSDGYLDLFVVRSSGPFTPSEISGKQDRLFHSEVADSNGFDDVTTDSGIGLKTTATKTIAASWADVDQDGNPDLYVASLASSGEYGTFYYNEGDSSFSDRTAAATGPAIGEIRHATGIVWADLDRDADLDLIISRVEGGGTANNLVTWQNDGNGRFSATQIGDIVTTVPLNGVMAVDYDLNGIVDLIGAPDGDDQAPMFAGYMLPTGLSYLERGERIGLSSSITQGLAVYDHDEDGDLDVFLGRTYSGTPSEVLYEAGRNAEHSVPAASWVGIALEAIETSCNNRYGIGARIEVQVPDTVPADFTIVGEMGSASGRGGQQQLVQYFGLGEVQKDILVTVYWPDGCEQSTTIRAEDLNAIHVISENEHEALIVSGTLELAFQPKPGGHVDWVIQWETCFESDSASLEITVDAGSKNGWQCYDPNGPLTLTSSTTNVTTSVTALPGGNYLNEMRWGNRPCSALCWYEVSNPTASYCEQPYSSTDTDRAQVAACLQ